jgi:hypothetical protein
MSNRTPLQHLLRSLLPPGRASKAATPAPDFEETRPDATAPPRRADVRRASGANSPLDASRGPAEGTDIMEYPDDTASSLMDQFFPGPDKRAS